jgi:hypothetical protein
MEHLALILTVKISKWLNLGARTYLRKLLLSRRNDVVAVVKKFGKECAKHSAHFCIY